MQNLKKINFNYYRNIPGVRIDFYAINYGGVDNVLAWCDMFINGHCFMTCQTIAHRSYFSELLSIDLDKCNASTIALDLNLIENQIDWDFEFPGEEAKYD